MKKRYVILLILGMLLLTTVVCGQSNHKPDVDMTFFEIERHFFGDSWQRIYLYRQIGIQTPTLEFLKEYYDFAP